MDGHLQDLQDLHAYAAGIARTRGRWRMLRDRFPDDFRQTLYLAVLESPHRDDRLARVVDRELWHLGRELGYFAPADMAAAESETAPCGIPECGRPGVYHDPRYGRLCRSHGMRVRMRVRRGWVDPYEGVADPTPGKTRNPAFWEALREHLPAEAYHRLWRWARDRRACPTADLATARAAIKEERWISI